jgi:hypothetical protein
LLAEFDWKQGNKEINGLIECKSANGERLSLRISAGVIINELLVSSIARSCLSEISGEVCPIKTPKALLASPASRRLVSASGIRLPIFVKD